MKNASIRPLRFRQIHLDFHTSEFIEKIGSEFNVNDFVSTFKQAHVDSVSLFAKCHHGWSYYPTEIGEAHPHLTRPDLLGEMIKGLNSAGIETPIYMTIQWDERTANVHPEYRVVKADNRLGYAAQSDQSALNQLSAAWHTLCLNHEELIDLQIRQAREILTLYPTVGIFFDIIQTTDCVCPECIRRMLKFNLNPESAEDRLKNDEAVNEHFRSKMSAMIRAEFPGTRIFYNSGHVNRYGSERFNPYTHLEIESLPTGGWGYNHFPVSARYAAKLGFDFLGQTGKFHTTWGEFGGFKHPQALDYECAMMAALGAKCLVGDQLHPTGRINHDTYRTIEPAYSRIEKLQDFLTDAELVSEIAILTSEYFYGSGNEDALNADGGVVQMLLELQITFDVIDPEMDFGRYRLIILPDVIPGTAALQAKLEEYSRNGGALLLSGKSCLDSDSGHHIIDTGLKLSVRENPVDPTYIQPLDGFAADSLPREPFVIYAPGEVFANDHATVLAEVVPPYFNRNFKHFSSHQHAPNRPDAASIGVAAAICGTVGTISHPIFSLYRLVGQPLYKYMVKALIDQLMPNSNLETTLTSGGRATVAYQVKDKRVIVHLLYGAPQIRGQSVKLNWQPVARPMEMVEDVPALGPVSFTLRLSGTPTAVYDALSRESITWEQDVDGAVVVNVPSLHIHRAIVIEGMYPSS